MARKKRKSLLPKRIAGVKVPKSVRKGRLGELLASQTGQALLAEAVLAAGAIGGVRKAADTAADKADDKVEAAGGTAGLSRFAGDFAERLKANASGGQNAAQAGAVMAVALGEAARAFVRALNEHQAPAEPEWRDPAGADQAAGSKKKPRAHNSQPH